MVKQIGVGLVLWSSVALAQDNHMINYKLYSKGIPVGHVETVRSKVMTNGEEVVRCEVTTDVNVNLLVFRYNMHAHEVSWSGRNGVVGYEKTMNDDGRKKDIRGAFREGAFCFEKPGRVNVARTDYDYTSQDNPEVLLGRVGDERLFRILNLMTMRVVQRKYRWVKNEELDGFLCKVIEIGDKENQIKRWIVTDDLGVVFIRQDGHEKEGAYSMRLTK